MRYKMEGAGHSELTTATLSGNLDGLLCIEYPGIVQNVDKAIDTLGGETNIAKAHYSSTPLGLKLRPGDMFYTPIVSHKEKVTGLVMKVKRKRKKGTDKWEKCETEVLGVVGSKYEFKGMADFQVLPPFTTAASSGAYRMDVLHDASLMDCSLPTFLPPVPFTRQDRPLEYSYQVPVGKVSHEGLRPPVPLRSIDFQDSSVPSGPSLDITDTILSEHPYYESLVKLFEQCPIWTRNALTTHIKVSYPTFRASIVLVAYCFSNGPWKTLLIRFGYDPRKHKESKMYQSFELRLPRAIELTDIPLYARDAVGSFDSTTSTHSDAEDATIYSYHYHSKALPANRFIYYRFCDLKNDEMQKVIHSNDGKETDCSEENGWCDAGTYEKLKTLSNKFVLTRAKELNVIT